MAEAIVQVRDVSKRFAREGFEVVALDHVSLDIEKGDFLALMGPSGSGKSTLLNLLAGIDRCTEGEVDVLGTNLARLSESQLAGWRNAHVGYIFQTFNLVPVLTAFENVELPLLLTKLSKAERRRNVTTALELVGLADRMNHQPRQLSGGQEQRVAIARAIVTDPDLILADEPTGNLDARSGEEILNILATLNRELKKTIVMVTHDPHAARHATQEKHLEKGVLLNGTGADAA
jgi:putative ABC transport system ATP-binding protein